MSDCSCERIDFAYLQEEGRIYLGALVKDPFNGDAIRYVTAAWFGTSRIDAVTPDSVILADVGADGVADLTLLDRADLTLSVRAVDIRTDAPLPDAKVFELGVPVFGICYGQQAMMHMTAHRILNTAISAEFP